eukprot:gene10361-12725_t
MNYNNSLNDKAQTIVNLLTQYRHYTNPARIRSDISDTFRFFPNLIPYYESVSMVWVPVNYPMEYPTIVLDPTPEMILVKNHQYVGDNGICVHPYIRNWTWSSTLSQLIKHLCDIYSAMPPLQAKVKYENNINKLTKDIEKLNDWIQENEKKDNEIDIDLLLAPKDALSNQLLQLVTEDATIEDTLYYMDKALHSSRITLDEYLKNIRSLARDQFMIRATMKKVQQQL